MAELTDSIDEELLQSVSSSDSTFGRVMRAIGRYKKKDQRAYHAWRNEPRIPEGLTNGDLVNFVQKHAPSFGFRNFGPRSAEAVISYLGETGLGEHLEFPGTADLGLLRELSGTERMYGTLISAIKNFVRTGVERSGEESYHIPLLRRAPNELEILDEDLLFIYNAHQQGRYVHDFGDKSVQIVDTYLERRGLKTEEQRESYPESVENINHGFKALEERVL